MGMEYLVGASLSMRANARCGNGGGGSMWTNIGRERDVVVNGIQGGGGCDGGGGGGRAICQWLVDGGQSRGKGIGNGCGERNGSN